MNMMKSLMPATSFAPLSNAVSEAGDAAGGITTTASMSLDDTFSGTLTSFDEDWVALALEANTSYVFSVWGTGGSITGLSDSILTLRNATGVQLAVNDDHIPGRNPFSLIEFTTTAAGTYYLNVDGYGSNAGDYTLSATDDILTPTQIASYLTDMFWGSAAPLAFNIAPGGTITYNIQNLATDGRQLAEWALEAWGEVSGINFQATTSTAAGLRFDDNQSGAFAGPGSYNPATGNINFSTVNVGTGWLSSYGTSIDSYSFLTYMHEIGHALGLGHAGGYNGSATYGTDNHYQNDSYQMTIMSYFGQNQNTTVDDVYALPIVPMMADIIAIQSLYGLGNTSTSGNTVWGENNTVGGYLGDVLGALFDGDTVDSNLFANRGNIAFTIFDSGGIDLIDLSGDGADTTVDLTPGNAAGIDGENANFLIAEGTFIENASTGSGNDTVIGNAVDNLINTGNGNDLLTGNAGADSLFGGNGNDTLEGGTGADVLNGGANNDSILGGSSIDRLLGGDGADTVRGGTGADTLYGDAGDDSIFGNTGVDLIYGGAGNDWISSGNGVDVAYGEAGNDTIIGRTGYDTIYGGDDNDALYGSEGQDLIFGDAGDDYVSGGLGFDTVSGGAGNDQVYGNLGSDSIMGDAGNDSLYGATGNDTLRGGSGDDLIYGSQGEDVIEGGAGNDTLFGGSLNDVFVFGVGDGRDTIDDYEIGRDILRLDSAITGSAVTGQDVLDMFGSTGSGNIVLSFGTDLSITITNHDSYDYLYTNPATDQQTTFYIGDYILL